MSKFAITLILATFAIVNCHANFSCGRCSGSYILTPDGQECPSPIKTLCSGLTGKSTTAWKRGTHVSTNCGSISSQTAIATFAGPGGTYNGGSFRHAAIFIRCDPNGIIVDDQWANHPQGGCTQRLIRSSGTGVNGANNFYTIKL